MWRNPTNAAVSQVKTTTITAAGAAGVIWTATLTEDDGSTVSVTATNDASPTIAEVVTALKNAWNASTNPSIARITATEASGTDVILTADTKGIPFSVAFSDDGAGTHAEVATTANVGNEDASLDLNWSQDDAPDTGDDLIFDPGTVSLRHGLNFSSITFTDIKVFKGFQGDFGRFEFGKFHWFRAALTGAFDYRGNGSLALFDIGASNISPYIEAYGSPSVQGRHNVYIKGSNIATLKIAKGNVGVAPLDADTATVATIMAGLLENPQSDVDVTIGAGVTLTTLTQAAGKVLLKCAATTVNVYPGAILTTEGSGAIGTVNVFAGGQFYPKSTGTITTLNLFGSADFSRDTSSKTVSTLNLKRGGKLVKHDAITITTFVPPSSSGGGSDTITAT